MVAWKNKILSSNATSSSLYGGQSIDYILDYFSDVDLSTAGADTLGLGIIATHTRFKSGAFQLLDTSADHRITFTLPEYTENHTATFPSESALGTSDEIMFKDAVQIITNKTISASSNVISDLPNQSGVAAAGTFIGDGGNTVYNIAHGMTPAPDFVNVEAASDDARGDFKVTVDSTNIVVTYASATSGTTGDISLAWFAGYINFSSYSFTPDSLTTMTQKTVGDALIFDTISTPSDPGSDQIEIYAKAIDASNDGFFIKQKLDSSIVEVRIS